MSDKYLVPRRLDVIAWLSLAAAALSLSSVPR